MSEDIADLDELLSLWETALSMEDEVDYPPFEGDETHSVGIVERGFASSRFLCSFTEGRLTFDATCLVGNVLSGRGSLTMARGGMLSVVRMARLLLRTEREVSSWVSGDSCATLAVHADGDVADYRLLSGSGEVVETGIGWQGLVEKIDALLLTADGGAYQIIMP